MILRKYCSSDCKEIVELFYNTVHTINAKDYTEEQLNVWAGKQINLDEWNQSFLNHYTIVAIENNAIVGFGDIDPSGYLDRLFVHINYQKRGVATAICDHLEQVVTADIVVHASITARKFFEKRNYQVIKKQQIIRQGVSLVNYVMVKKR